MLLMIVIARLDRAIQSYKLEPRLKPWMTRSSRVMTKRVARIDVTMIVIARLDRAIQSYKLEPRLKPWMTRSSRVMTS
jgi:hypothetical protein